MYKIIDYRIDLYCSGYCNLDVYHQSLIPTKSVLNHQINDKKAHFSEVYFYNRAISSWEFKKEKNKNFLISNTPLVGKIASKEYLKFLGIPFELNYNQEKIDLRDVLNVLYEFSYNLMPEGRIFLDETNPEEVSLLPQVQKPKDFLKYFQPDYMHIYI